MFIKTSQKITFTKTFSSFFAMLLIVACESNFKQVQKINITAFTPSGSANDVNLKYTDSSLIKLILTSPKMLDYGNQSFPFTEFPNGIHLTLFDKTGKKTNIYSNYAISYKPTNIIDLKGNVRIIAQDGQSLETEQLYFDQKNEWFFTEKKFKFNDTKGGSTGQGIDFSKDFKIINSQRISGEINSVE